MSAHCDTVLILGSAPNAIEAADWSREHFDHLVAINNAWAVRPDWSHLIHPEDFPEERRPIDLQDGQKIVDYTDYIPQQNAYGGVVYAGGTMAFTAGYWALGALRPRVMAFMGCDMMYASAGNTHFYGTGEADPLRDDITLQSLEAKSARLALLAAQQGCACVNLSSDPSRLLFPRRPVDSLRATGPLTLSNGCGIATAQAREEELSYTAPDGRYWQMLDQFDADKLAEVDGLWLNAFETASIAVA
ncbi:hypothetical protein BXY66_3276 [Shimia isoporae]|uniref:Uncharacterized protein n=1 Tax=Shimia isoporae TaxID=647720 RepID=A0A4R1N2S9_9RHOB|nr:hypothetical protein [Shimia isoporae]TCL00629.1 hypothetical protein BXY66_3276 [Shimia isoporae]